MTLQTKKLIKHVAIYLRISRDKGENVDTLQNHRERLIRLCEERDYTYTIYEEIISGQAKLEDRQVLTKLLSELQLYDGVVTVAIDRLSRDLEFSIHIFKALEKAEIPVITPERIYTEQDFTLFAIESTLAHGEYKQIRKRMLQGKRDKALRGEVVSSRPPFGYDSVVIDRKRTYVPNNDSEVVKTIFNLAVNGYGCIEISKKTGKSYKSVQNILKNKAYYGLYQYKDIEVENAFTPIIDKENWNKAQEGTKARYNKFDGDKKVRTREKGEVRTILKDLLYCDSCGRKISFQWNGYQRLVTKKCVCGMSGVNESRLLAEFYYQFASTEIYLREQFEKVLSTPLIDSKALLENQVHEQLKSQEKLNKRLMNARDMRLDGELSKAEYEDIKKDTEKELKSHTKIIKELQQEIESNDTEKVKNDYREKLKIIGEVKELLPDNAFLIKGEMFTVPLPEPTDVKEANRLLKLLIDRIYYKRGDILNGEGEIEGDVISLMIAPK